MAEFKGEIKLDVRDGGRIKMPTMDGEPETRISAPISLKKVVFDIDDDVYVDVDAHLAAAYARD